MHPHLKESRSGHEAKLKKLSGTHGTENNPSGNIPRSYEVRNGPQRNGVTAEGKAPKPNLGKFARGGRAKNKGTTVNVVVAPKAGPDMPAAMPPVAGMPVPAPSAPPPMAGPALPPGVPPRKNGGRTYKRGGSVKMRVGAGSGEGREEKARKYGAKTHGKAPKV